MKKSTGLGGLFIFLAFVLGAVGLAVAGISTARTVLYKNAEGKRVLEYTSTITASTAGAAVGTFGINGRIVRATTEPGIIATLPLAAWDCVLTDKSGADIYEGGLQNRIASSGMQAYPTVTGSSVDTTNIAPAQPTEPRIDGTVRLSCSNIGTSRVTILRLYVKEE